MKNSINKSNILPLITILIALAFMAGCGNGEEKKKNVQNPAVGSNQIRQAVPASNTVPATTSTEEKTNIAVSVNGHILKKSALEKDMKERMDSFQNRVPAEKVKEVRENMKKQMVDEFIMRTLMSEEVEKRKIAATDKEVKNATDQIKANIPPDKKLETFMKENKITREDIILGIKVKKMVIQDLGKNARPSQKEIGKFYDENKDKFMIPENVHVRHILVALKEGDDDNVKAEKKKKIEDLHKQIMDGADFAEVASKNSDCPSKEKGGDLGQIQRGQTVKPFEDAAFSQEKNVVGPVVATDYGYHIIQVLEHNQQKTTPLTDMQEKISYYLEQQKQTESFNALLKKLRENAKIIHYEN